MSETTKSVRLRAEDVEYIEREAESQNTTEADVMRQLVRDGRQYNEELAAIQERLAVLGDVQERLHLLQKRVRYIEQNVSDDGRSRLFG